MSRSKKQKQAQTPATATITPTPVFDVQEIIPMRLDLPEHRDRLNRIYSYILTTIDERRQVEEAEHDHERRSA